MQPREIADSASPGLRVCSDGFGKPRDAGYHADAAPLKSNITAIAKAFFSRRPQGLERLTGTPI